MTSADNATAWGHPERHYAASSAAAPRPAERSGADIGRVWQKALEAAAPGSRDLVERTFKQWNTILRDYLRTETALRLTVGEDAQSIPVRIVDGMPRRFAEALQQFEDLAPMLLQRPALEAAASGTAFMEKHIHAVRGEGGVTVGPSDANEIQRVNQTARAWLAMLDEAQVVDRITGIDEDVLGAYFFRVPEIRLYWVVIGITARSLGVPTEALTIVVLAHELAHAYTHLGRDIDNERWDTERLAAADLHIVEGLAQFYTHVICTRLEQRMPAALTAFNALLDKQSDIYKAHCAWTTPNERGGEIIRVSMIECRSRGVTELAIFAEAVERHRNGVRGRRSPGAS